VIVLDEIEDIVILLLSEIQGVESQLDGIKVQVE
jgi:hypothetical protein